MSTGQQPPQGDIPKLDSDGLANVTAVVQASMESIQQTLAQELARVSPIPAMGVPDLVQIQYNLASYTAAQQTLSAIMKDMSDTMKTVAQHIG